LKKNNLSINREDLALADFHRRLDDGAPIEQAFAITVVDYPECADLLSDSALYNSTLSLTTSIDPEIDAAAARAFARASDRHRPAQPSSLLALINDQQISISDFVGRLNVGVSVLRKLDQRQIIASSIPAAFVNLLANILNETTDRITEYLGQQPSFSTGSTFRGDVSPLPFNESFATALNTSLVSGEIGQDSYDFWRSHVDRDGL